MKREHRYIVIKIKDAERVLSKTGFAQLEKLCGFVRDGRKNAGKPPLECVVVESDWPEYEPTWAAIAARMDGLSPQPQQAAVVPEVEMPDGMWKISKLIDALQRIHTRFGDTCVWSKELKWGAAALHAEADERRAEVLRLSKGE